MSNQIRILLADDNNAFTDLFESRLNLYSNIKIVGVAKNGSETTQMLNHIEIDVLLLDIVMPDIDGLEILRKINEMPINPMIIIISAISSEEITKIAFSLGARYYFVKPFDCDNLISTIKSEILNAVKPNMSDVNSHIRKIVTNILLQIKIPNYIQGFSFLREIIVLYIKRNCRNNISMLYNEIALSKNIKAASVYQAIRYAIQVAYQNNFGIKSNKHNDLLFNFNGMPNNLQFIKAVASIYKLTTNNN